MVQRLTLKLLYTDARLADLLQAVDELHTAASEDLLAQVTPLTAQDMIGWLKDLVYTAEETIAEIEQRQPKPTTARLRVLPRPGVVAERAGRDAI